MNGSISDIVNTHQTLEVSLNQTDFYSLVSSIASIILSVLAIGLSLYFFFYSKKSSDILERSSKDISDSLVNLNRIFTDFKENIDDFKQNVWSTYNKNYEKLMDLQFYNQKPVNPKVIDLVEQETHQALSDAAKDIKSNPGKTEKELEALLQGVLNKSKEVEDNVKTNVLREEIINYLKNHNEANYRQIRNHVLDLGIVGLNDGNLFWDEIKQMAFDKIISASFEDDGSIKFNSKITLLVNNTVGK